MKTGAQLISDERERQVNVKGWDAAHDDGHTDQSIRRAAAWIINDADDGTKGLLCHTSRNDEGAPWPETLAVHVREKYGEDQVRRLTIAGALIAAEIDRLQRAGANNG